MSEKRYFENKIKNEYGYYVKRIKFSIFKTIGTWGEHHKNYVLYYFDHGILFVVDKVFHNYESIIEYLETEKKGKQNG